ncbi:unnamed protein product [Penicillium salamii]|uniref:SH3 domain-containing protein n=1 Tax=Penicillium salamii TaxID=1612424 RepID=A0A9W4NUI9_9EURO|nr:unnamed protein product [Penicillium salamii]CAG8255349.1 unnamed protein product [Penicillium salamii]CAG8311158.1 unnamed protein product [Penicillium salamii]CAG8320793.1 unnamed protein product [Penicillium salamii]CAG8339382.1 unnamed protein product [Penicillium salamii]
MSSIVAKGMYDARSNANGGGSWASPVPASHETPNEARQQSPNSPQSSSQLSGQQSPSSNKNGATPDDGYWHPNGQQSSSQQSASNPQSGSSQQSPSNQQSSPNQQSTSNQQSTTPQSTSNQQSSSNAGSNRQSSSQSSSGGNGVTSNAQAAQAASNGGTAGQQTASGQNSSPQLAQQAQDSQSQTSSSSSQGQANSNAQSNGQYSAQSNGNQQSGSSSYGSAQSQSGQQQQQQGGSTQSNQQPAPAQHGPSMEADRIEQSDWIQNAPTNTQWNSAVDHTQSPIPTETQAQHTTAQEASTSPPGIPSSQSQGTTATSAAASAGIALAVIATLGLIAVLILVPLHKKRKRLRKLLGHHQREKDMDERLKRHMHQVNDYVVRGYAQTHRMARSATGFLRPKRHASPYVGHVSPNLGQTSRNASTSEKVNPTIIPIQSPELALHPAFDHSPHPSFTSWSTTRSKSSCNSSLHHPHDDRPLSPTSNNLGQFYGQGSAENLSMGNIVAVNPLMNKIYTVEMDYKPGKPGQLDLRAGQRLTILQVYDHGWAVAVRLDSPEAGLVPRSHISAVPDERPIACSDELAPSQRNSMVQQPLGALTSRFYSLFAQPEPHRKPSSPA